MNLRLTPVALFSVLLLHAIATPSASQAPADAKRDVVEWVTDLDQALAAAKVQQRLLLICFNMDGEERSERDLQMYRSAEFCKATANVIHVLCAADQHSTKDAPCPRFSSCTCRAHIACEKQVRRHFFGHSQDTLAPQQLLLFQDGTVAWQAIYDVVPAELFKAITASEKQKSQPLDQRLRVQRLQIATLSAKASKGTATAYLQLRAMLVQTPAPNFCEALQAMTKDVAERVLRDLGGHQPEQALTLLDAAAKHPTKSVRDLAVRLAAEIRARPAEGAQVATEGGKPAAKATAPLDAPLPALGTADDFARVHWAGTPQTLAGCRDHVTVLWFFLLEMPDLTQAIATMNEFAAANRARGIETVGLAATARAGEAANKLATLGLRFPAGAYSATADYRPYGIERFPSWVVLDPDTSVVHCSPQDGSAFDLESARTLALRMTVTPSYVARIKPTREAK